MRIITISREFGSGGHELGRRLAEILDIDFYDKEIISALAANKDLDQDYMARTLAQGNLPGLGVRRSATGQSVVRVTSLQEQKRVIQMLPTLGRDFVIVGRNADILLEEYEPLNLFVCAGMEAKLRRCKERVAEGENLSDGELERKIRSIDKARYHTRELLTGAPWGVASAYHLTVNTSSWQIQELAPAVAEFVLRWFGRSRPRLG